MNIFALLCTGSEKSEKLWTDRVVFLFLIETERGGMGTWFMFLQYIECLEFNDGAEEMLNTCAGGQSRMKR